MSNYFCDLENRPTKEVAPGVKIRTYWQNEMLLSVVDLEPNALVPLHQHPHEQSGTMIWGEMNLTIDGETRLLKAGDCYIIPGGVEHMAVATDQAVRIVDIFAPVREEYKY